MSNFSDEWDKRVDKTVERLTVSMTLYHTASFIHSYPLYPPPRPSAQDRARIVFDCRMANDSAIINKESTNENNTDVDRWADARRLRINGKPCS